MSMRKVAASLLAAAMILPSAIMPATVKAAETEASRTYDSGVIFQEMDLIDLNKAPEFNGVAKADEDAYDVSLGPIETDISKDAPFVFGGWYVSRGEVKSGDTKSEYYTDETMLCLYDTNMGLDAENDTVLAKWVPARVLSVKAQNSNDTTSSTEKTSTRVVSSVDCKDYKSVGFDIIIDNDEKRKVETKDMKNVYSSLIAGSSTKKSSEMFGNASKYFAVARMDNIPKSDFGTKFFVKPYWVTAQGLKVYGLPRYSHVEDGIEGYINVPVNLSTTNEQAIAAGVVSVKYDTTKFTYVPDKMEAGRVFEEMDANAAEGTVKIVGNVADITKNATNTDLFVNLRFKKVDNASVIGTTWFSIDTASIDFCNNEEVVQDVTVSDIPY